MAYLLTDYMEDDEAKYNLKRLLLSDFGISIISKSDLIQFRGTDLYMAPEKLLKIKEKGTKTHSISKAIFD